MSAGARSGQCLCGEVRFTLRAVPGDLHACHCSACRRSSGLASMTLVVPFAAMEIAAGATVTSYQSSDWAARSFCGRCGAALWYRLTGAGAETADYYLSAGTLDDLSGLRLTEEIYIDCKPDAWAFAGLHDRLTGAEFEARLSANPEE